MSKAIAGDDAAFATLYVNVQPALRRYAATLVAQDADDVTADAWLHIARDVRSFRGDLAGFRGWAVRIVRNRAIDDVRHRARRPARSMQQDDPLDAVAPDDTASAALERVSTAEAVKLISSLPREQAEAVFLRAVVGLDARSAGDILGKSPEAVRVAAHRGLRRLAARVGRHPGNGDP